MISSTYSSFLKPYQENAQSSGQQINDYIQNNLNNNQGYNDIISGYQEDPGMKYRRARLLGQAYNQNAAQGTAGTGFNNYQNADIINQLLSEGQQQYFNNRVGLQNSALGAAQGIYGQGLQASQLEADEAYRQELLEMQREKDEQSNSFLGSLGNLIFGGIGTGLGLGISGPVKGATSAITGGFINKLGNKIGGKRNYTDDDYNNTSVLGSATKTGGVGGGY